jgi:hypothetical protein
VAAADRHLFCLAVGLLLGSLSVGHLLRAALAPDQSPTRACEIPT